VTREEFLRSREWAALKEAAGGELSPNFRDAGKILADYLKKKGLMLAVIFGPDGKHHRVRFVSPNRPAAMFDVVINGEQWAEEIGIRLQALIRYHDALWEIRTILHPIDKKLSELQ
jgi:hypothetical protein